LAEYVSDIRKLVIKGYEITRETIIIRHFIKGLQDQQAALNIGKKDQTRNSRSNIFGLHVPQVEN
jgi:hypothetical protein